MVHALIWKDLGQERELFDSTQLCLVYSVCVPVDSK